MIELFFMPGNAPSRAVLMGFKQLGLAVDLWPTDRLYADAKKLEEFQQGNPFKTLPTINDNGFFLWESRTILRYLVDTYGEKAGQQHLYPKDNKERAKIDCLLDFDLGSLFTSIYVYFEPQLVNKSPPDLEKEKKMKNKLDQLDDLLKSGNTFIHGKNLTIADLSLLASVTELQCVDYSYSTWTNVNNWVTKLKSFLPYNDEVNDKALKIFRDMLFGTEIPFRQA